MAVTRVRILGTPDLPKRYTPRHLWLSSTSKGGAQERNSEQDAVHLRAAQRADVLLDEGDVDGAVIWRRILEAIEELQRGRREGERLN
jgi:hypothetical protein